MPQVCTGTRNMEHTGLENYFPITESAMHFNLLKIYNKNRFPPGFDLKIKAM